MEDFYTETFDLFYNEFKDVLVINKDLYKAYCIFIRRYVR